MTGRAVWVMTAHDAACLAMQHCAPSSVHLMTRHDVRHDTT